MRSQKLLIFSLFLNVCLLALALYSFFGAKRSPAGEPESEPGKVEATNDAPTGSPPRSRADWQSIRTTNWPQYVKNLRSRGFPEETVRDIIFAEVNKSYAARWRSTNGDGGGKYWVSKREGWWGHTKQKEFNTMEREKKELIRSLLGVDADAQLRKYLVLNYDANVTVQQLDFLPADRRKRCRELLDKDDRAIQAVWVKQQPGGGLPVEAQHELNVAMQQRKKDLEETLSPTELEEYDLRNSALAKDLRRQLYGFETTEKEFRDIFKAQKKLHDEFAEVPYNSTDEKTNQRRAVAAEATENEIRDALGEKRYADYLRTKSMQYKQLLNFADEFELSRETANQAYEIIKRAGDEMKRLQGDSNLNDEQRQARNVMVQKETDDALTKVIGEKGLKYYKLNYGGWMLNAGR